MKTRYIVFLLGIFLLACNDETTNNPPSQNPTDSDPVQYGVPFAGIPETNEIIMYEVNLLALGTSANLQGVTGRIDSIRSLGINVIWLMPIYPIGELNSVNSPYCVKDYTSVNPDFGDLDDLRELTDKAHERGMAVILDWVANHTSWDNAWIENTDWYTQENGEIISPAETNWADVADLNYDNQEMRDAMIDAMKYWILAANIDGYRCDAADYIPLDFWQQAIDSLLDIPGREIILLAEGGRKDHFTAGFQMTYAWDFYNQLKNIYAGTTATSIFTVHSSEYSGIPAGKHKLRYTTNHDESAWNTTPIALFNGKEGAMAASVITICMGGVPMIYCGQEVGNAGLIPIFSTSSINWEQNPDMLAMYKALLNYHKQSAALKTGTLQSYADKDIVAFQRITHNKQVLVFVNVRNSLITYALPAAVQQTEWENVLTGETVSLDTSLSMEPYSFMVLHNN
ncbi:MAG: alpha-amylase [Bacteroidales bacterium]|nr:alpha-amylase [Bacteroidales bacterium]